MTGLWIGSCRHKISTPVGYSDVHRSLSRRLSYSHNIRGKVASKGCLRADSQHRAIAKGDFQRKLASNTIIPKGKWGVSERTLLCPYHQRGCRRSAARSLALPSSVGQTLFMRCKFQRSFNSIPASRRECERSHQCHSLNRLNAQEMQATQ